MPLLLYLDDNLDLGDVETVKRLEDQVQVWTSSSGSGSEDDPFVVIDDDGKEYSPEGVELGPPV